jgi:PAS domain S-box-containing protein
MAKITADNWWSPRITAYLFVGIALTLSYVTLRGVVWSGESQIHMLMETVAATLAAIIGVIALVRFYSKKNNTILFIGAGFLGTAFLDAYHTILTANYFVDLTPSDLPSLISWSGIASRQLLATMLFLSWLAWLYEQRSGSKGEFDARTIYAGTALLTIACFLFFAFTPLPRGYYPGSFLHRPEDFVPALFFAAALFGYLRKGLWRNDAFEHWLVLALIISVISQVVFMPFSAALFDFNFNAAHLLKITSYICVLVGLLIGMYETFQEVDFNAIRVQAVLTNAIDGIITIDEQGTVQDFNFAAESIFGYQANEIIGLNVKALMPEPDRGQHDQYLINFITTGEKKIIGTGREVVGLRKDGTTFPMHLGVTEARIANTRTFIGSTRDITQLKQAERKVVEHANQLEAANAELDAFAYSVSHDLRAPLRSMGGFAEALAEDYGDKFDGDGLDYLGRIGKASERMGRMIDDILALSRTMRLDMTLTPVNLSAIAESILSEHREAEPDRDVSVIIAPDVIAYGDRRLMEIVLRNLLHNAWKFSSSKAQARIEFNSLVMEGENVFFVRDNGAGFDMAYVDKLFGIFQRLHSKTEYQGNGIGLATVARLVGRHGGRVWAEAVEYEGATVYFTVGT